MQNIHIILSEILIGTITSLIVFYFKYKQGWGKTIIGAVIASLGALFGNLILDRFIIWLANAVYRENVNFLNINIIACFVGAYVFLYIFMKITPIIKYE